MTAYEHSFLRALAVSLAVELPVVLLGARLVLRAPVDGVGTARLAAAAVLATAATLPYLWFLAPFFLPMRGPGLAAAEALVIAAEAIIYRLTLDSGWRPCLGLSAAANLASWAVGTFL